MQNGDTAPAHPPVARDKTIVLITGANTGIGWETVKALLQSPVAYHVLLGSRSLDKGEQAIALLKRDVPATQSTVALVQIDLASDEAILKAFERVKCEYGRVDVLINNAGISLESRLRTGDMSHREAWTQTYNINVAGTEVLTHTFAPLLLASLSPRLLFLTSGLSSLAGMSQSYAPGPTPVPAGWPKKLGYAPDSYRASKAALNMLMLGWFWKLRGDGVKVWCVSPGFLATGLLGGAGGWLGEESSVSIMRKRGAGHPNIGGRLVVDVVEGRHDGAVGRVVAGHGVQPF